MSEYNEAPKGLQEISEKEFAQSWFFSYEPDKREFRQVIDEERGWGCYDLTMYWHGNTGIAMHSDYWEGKVRYYKFGCEHEWREFKKKPYWLHHERCELCGEERSYDSSD